MNNPIIVTDRALSYYDTRLKEYIGANYGDGMLIDWEPMENGKNPFKLKIALKNRYGAELFSKIVDFPLEQTIVSGEYNNEDKSLILYFQDGSYTSIPIEDLIEGLATRLDLEKKADLGEKSIVRGNGYTVSVPVNSAPYARLNKIGGMCYTSRNLVKFPYYDFTDNAFEINGIKGTVDPKTQIIHLVGVATADVDRRLCTLDVTAGKSYTIYAEQSWNQTRVVLRKNGAIYLNSAKDNAPHTFTVNSGETWTVYIQAFSGMSQNDTIRVMVNEGTTALPFEPYFTGLYSAGVTSVRCTGNGKEHILAIPKYVRNIEGYGQGNPDNVDEYNYIDLKNQKFISFGYISDGVWIPRYSQTDIELPNIIGIEGSSTITFENEYGYGVPYEIEYTLNSNDAIGAKEFVGDLKGTAEMAKYYDDNGKISNRTIGEILTQLLNEGNPVKVTVESIGTLATADGQKEIRGAGIIANPPISAEDIVIDTYLDSSNGNAAYLCFWKVESVDTANVTLAPLSSIYVGGGSASVANQAIADGEGRNIVNTYETKSNALYTHSALRSDVDSASAMANNALNMAASTEAVANDAKELAQTANNNADSARARADRGVQSISATYNSSYNGQGTFKLNVTLVGGTKESFDITDELSGFIMDVFSHNQ